MNITKVNSLKVITRVFQNAGLYSHVTCYSISLSRVNDKLECMAVSRLTLLKGSVFLLTDHTYCDYIY